MGRFWYYLSTYIFENGWLFFMEFSCRQKIYQPFVPMVHSSIGGRWLPPSSASPVTPKAAFGLLQDMRRAKLPTQHATSSVMRAAAKAWGISCDFFGCRGPGIYLFSGLIIFRRLIYWKLDFGGGEDFIVILWNFSFEDVAPWCLVWFHLWFTRSCVWFVVTFLYLQGSTSNFQSGIRLMFFERFQFGR